MQVSEIKDDILEKHLRITIPVSDVAAKIDSELSEIAKTARMPGFRAGKVPVSLLKTKYGEAIFDDATRSLVDQSTKDIIKDRNFSLIRQPRIMDLVRRKDEDLAFTMVVELMPKFDMPNLSKIKIEKPVLQPSAAELDQEIETIRKNSATFPESSKGKAENGDMVVLSCRGYLDGIEFKEGQVEDYDLVLGSGSFIPGFEEQLVGAKAGSKVQVEVTFPEAYHAERLAGKPAVFQVDIKDVKKKKEAILDDEFAKKYGAKSVEELKAMVAKNMQAKYQSSIATMLKLELFDQLEDMLQFDVPSSMLNQEYDAIKAQAKDFEDDEEYSTKSDSEKEEYLRKIAARRVRIGIYLAEYAKGQNLTVEQRDIEMAIYEQARRFPGQEKMIFDLYSKNPQLIQSLHGSIIESKAVRHLLDNAISTNEKTYNAAELDKLLEDGDEASLAKSKGGKAKSASAAAKPAKKAASKSKKAADDHEHNADGSCCDH